MKLPTEFWQVHGGLLLIADDGTVRFTRAGRARYLPRLARYGYRLADITDLASFCEVMEDVTAGELEANASLLQAMLESPSCSPCTRASIRRVLAL